MLFGYLQDLTAVNANNLHSLWRNNSASLQKGGEVESSVKLRMLLSFRLMNYVHVCVRVCGCFEHTVESHLTIYQVSTLQRIHWV